MKVGMYILNPNTKQERMVCRFICCRCGEPIEDIREANFAPPDDLADDPVVITQHMHLWTDRLNIYHWDCDNGGTPWQNASAGLCDYIEAGLTPPVTRVG